MTAAGDLVEREDALRAIGSALDSARSGSGSLVLVEAPPMAGTSAVLRAAVTEAEARSLAARWAQAGASTRPASFGVARRLLGPPLEALDPDRRDAVLTGAAGRAREWLEGAYQPAEPDLLESLADLAARLARELDGLAFVVDDCHTADAESLRLIEATCAALADVPLAVVLGVEDRERERDPAIARLVARTDAARVPLPPLSERGVARWAARRLGDDDDGLAADLRELTGGSPWLLDVAFDALERQAGSFPNPDPLGEEAPALVRGRVDVELGGMGGDALEVARALAVIGEPCKLRTVAEVAQLTPEAAGAGLDALAGARLTTAQEPLRFRQPLIGVAVAARIPGFARAGMHERAYRAIVALGEEPERAAHHLLHVPAGGDPDTAAVLRSAARRATADDQRILAVALLRRALEEPPADAERGRVLAELALAEGAAGEERGISRLEEALARSDVGDRGPLHVALSRLLFAHNAYPAAAAAVDAALEELGPDHPLAEQLIAVDVVTSGQHPELVPQALQRAMPYLERAGRGEIPDDPGFCAWIAAAFGAMGGSVETVRALVDRALRDNPLVDDSHESIYSFVRAALMNIDDAARAEATASAAMERARERRLRVAHDLAQHGRALARFRLGRLDEALADAAASLPLRHAGWAMHASYNAAMQAEVHVERGELEAARRLVAIAEEHVGSPLERSYVRYAQSAVELAEGDADAALQSALAAGEALAELGFEGMAPRILLWASAAATAAAAAGDIERSRELAEGELALTRESGLPGRVGESLRSLALSEDGERRVEVLREAVAELEESPARLHLARALVDLGAAIRAAGDPLGAREPLAAGLDLADRCGATVLVERAREELRLAGAKPRRAARSGPDSLTPRERRIAELAAAGRSNPEIAAELAVSVRTVEGTLSRVYRKLEISSRSELAVELEL